MDKFSGGNTFTIRFTNESEIDSIGFFCHSNNLCNLIYDDCYLSKDEVRQFESVMNGIVESKKVEGAFGENDYGKAFSTNVECYGNIIINVYKTLFNPEAIVEIVPRK